MDTLSRTAAVCALLDARSALTRAYMFVSLQIDESTAEQFSKTNSQLNKLIGVLDQAEKSEVQS